ncbi:SurA N-terminal domain-containing protein [Sneathiella sp.]|uniref:SurA N-terminal domain-containing protein n=1 Tax=Sneathiella sp. TaxID=1964365 RepID=UPI0025F5F7A6|nr:SurA N-terminal domain-containing protein [Sneathiella sp.]
MRKGASGWLAKGLLLLLVASFAVWGIGGDMLTSSVGSNVIEVGKTRVSLGEFQRDYQRNLNILSQRFGTQLTQEQARQFGLAQMTINQIASRALIAEKTRSMGLNADDDAIRNVIRSQPAFQNQFNQFDRIMFEQFLAQNGYSEAQYVEIVRNNITGEQLFGSLPLGIAEAPAPLTDTIYGFIGEKRSADYINILDSSIGFAPAPTDEELQTLVDDNPENYTAPEYRKISYILLTPASVAAETEISDDELQADYEARKEEFDIPEKRTVQQMIFETEDAAKAAQAKITEGQSFADVAMSDLQLTTTDINLGVVSPNDLLPELQGPIFALQKDAVTEPVKTVLGWHLATVTDIEPGEARSFADVKDDLKQELQLQRSHDLLYDRAAKLEDEFAGGATLADAAQTLGFKVVTTDWIDANGLQKSGDAAADLPQSPGFLSEAFARTTEDEPEVSELAGGGYYSLAVNAVEDAAVKPLAEVKDQAIQDWQNSWRHQETVKKAEALQDRLEKGESLEAIAAELSLPVQTSTAALRNEMEGELSPAALEDLFTLQPGAYGVSVNKEGNGTLLYGLNQVIPADPETDKEMFTQISGRIMNSLRAGIVAEYENHLQKEIGMSVKEELIQEYF